MASAPPTLPAPAAHRRSARALGVATSLTTLSLAVALAVAVDDLAHGDVRVGVAVLLGIVAARWLVSTALDAWDERVAGQLRAAWRATLVSHLALPLREGARGRGDLALAVDHVAHAPSLERLRIAAATSLLGVVVVFWAAGWLPLVITLGLLALAVPLYRHAGRRAEALNLEHRDRRATLETRQLEVLQHAPELRALGAVDFGAAEVAALSDSEHALALRTIRVALESSLVTEFLSGVSVGLVAMVVGFALLGGRISLVRALVAVLVTSELFVQVRRYGVEFHRRDEAARAERVLRFDSGGDATTGDGVLLAASGLVTEADETPIDLTLRSGERVLVTGPSGAGKTTLLHTLLGWRRSRAGTHARTLAPVGYVSVDSAFVSGSLRENLTLGAALADEDVVARLSSLGLTGPRFEDLDAALLADGRGLSTGERVRLALARDLLAGARLIVLDDVAGVLDDEARARVRDVLASSKDLAVLEATVDTPLLLETTRRVELRP